jgi:hypothetical protein
MRPLQHQLLRRTRSKVPKSDKLACYRECRDPLIRRGLAKVAVLRLAGRHQPRHWQGPILKLCSTQPIRPKTLSTSAIFFREAGSSTARGVIAFAFRHASATSDALASEIVGSLPDQAPCRPQAHDIRARSTRLADWVRDWAIDLDFLVSASPSYNSQACRHAMTPDYPLHFGHTCPNRSSTTQMNPRLSQLLSNRSLVSRAATAGTSSRCDRDSGMQAIPGITNRW